MFEKTVESPLDCRNIKPVNPKANQSWIFIGRTDAEAEAPMVGWHHRVNGPEFEQTLGDDEGQGSLACCSLWGFKELDTTEWLNNNKVPPGKPQQTIAQHQTSSKKAENPWGRPRVLVPLIRHNLLKPRALCSQEELSVTTGHCSSF